MEEQKCKCQPYVADCSTPNLFAIAAYLKMNEQRISFTMIINTFLKDVSSISNHHHVKTDLFKFICVREMTIVAFVSTYATIKLGNKIKRKVINQSMTYAYTNTYWYYIIHSLYPKERKINWERERERERETYHSNKKSCKRKNDEFDK